MHHCNPGILISEVVANANQLRPHLSDPGIVDVLKTADWRLWCNDEDAKKAMEEACPAPDSTCLELRDLTRTVSSHSQKLQLSDLIIIPIFLLATDRLEQLLQTAKQLLASSGRLCLTVPATQAQEIVALGRAAGLNDWIMFNDVEDPSKQRLTLLVGSSSCVEGIRDHVNEEVIILQSPNPSKGVTDAAVHLSKSLISVGYRASIIEWGSGTVTFKNKTVISLLEIDNGRPFLQDISEEDFAELKLLILESSSLLWVSSIYDPGHSIVTGLSRVIRNEEPGLSFRTLHVDFSNPSLTAGFTDNVLRILNSDSEENEFMVKDDIIHISRIVEDDALNQKLDLLDPQKRKTIVKEALENTGPLKLFIQNPGLLDSLCFELDSLPATDLENDEIEITVMATSLK